MCPDYWIRADHIMAAEDRVLAAGEACGTIDGESWRTPAAWRAVIRDGRVQEWQVFADNKPVYEIQGGGPLLSRLHRLAQLHLQQRILRERLRQLRQHRDRLLGLLLPEIHRREQHQRIHAIDPPILADLD